jgi:ATP-dependent DNA ligase
MPLHERRKRLETLLSGNDVIRLSTSWSLCGSIG